MFKSLLIALLSACLSLPALAATNYTTITSTLTTDASGAPLASGTATIRVVDAAGHPLPVKLVNGGQIIMAPVSAAVTSGSFTIQSVDVSQTQPSFPCVSLTIVDNSTGDTVWQNNCLQPTGATYDLDQFSTNVTPVLPQAGDNIAGDLSVNGNLSVTGNLNMGGLTVASLFATTENGSVNAALFAGSDIGAKAMAAFSTCSNAVPCHVFIPPGNYSYSTPILLPKRTNGNELTIDRNAVMTYTGTGDAIGTQPLAGNIGGTMIDGGGVIVGTAAANSGIHIRPGQAYTIKDVAVRSFTSGDGIWIDGANVVKITGVTSAFNLNGLHVTGNTCNAAGQCTWDINSSHVWVNSGVSGVGGYAPNALSAHDNRFIQNIHWGILEGDVIGGSVSAAFGNHYYDNDMEVNGTGGSNYGAALTGFTSGSTFGPSNYFEASPRGIVIGCVNGDPGVSVPTGYTSQFCGTAGKTTVTGNFFNDPSTTSEVMLLHAASPSVIENVVSSNAACLADNYASSGNIHIEGNAIFGTGSEVCSGGGAGGPLTNFQESADTSINMKHFHGAVQVDGSLNSNGGFTLNKNEPTFGSGGSVVGKIGPIIIWQAPTDPGGLCGSSPQVDTNIWFSPLGLSICQGGQWVKVGH